MAGLKMSCAVVMLMVVVFGPMAEAAITCNQVQGQMASCVGFLRSGGAVPPACCAGVRGLNSAAKTPADRKAACECLKSGAGKISGIKLANAAALPGRCGVNIPYQISPSTNCANVK